MLRLALSQRADLAPAAWRFAAAARGKPYLVAPPCDLRFSLSHTRGMIAVAVADDVEIGVDVEAPRGAREPMKLAERFFAPPEITALREAPDEDARRDLFLQFWTLKEAVVKATGEGLARALNGFSVAGAPPALAFTDGPAEPRQSASWTLRHWRQGDFHLAAAIQHTVMPLQLMTRNAPALIRTARGG